MSEEIKLEGLGVAQSVLETIVTLAAEGVEGVTHVGTPGLAGLVRKGSGKGSNRPVEISREEGGVVKVAVHIRVAYGQPLRSVASAVQDAVVDALISQVGLSVESVDVFVDGIDFDS